MMRGVALFALTAVSTAARQQAGVTPVQKVIQLLNGMVEKGKAEKQEEQVMFAAYKQKFEADAKQLGHEISVHDEDIATWEGDKKAATKVRDIEKSDYIAEHQDISSSIDALGR